VALFYRSFALLAYAGLFVVAAHLFVLSTRSRRCGGSFLRSTTYCLRVGRWSPRLRRGA
jgi:hypothetical protein